MATPFVSHLFPHTEGTLLMYRTSLAQQMGNNVKNESVCFNCLLFNSFPIIECPDFSYPKEWLENWDICSKIYSLRKPYHQDEIVAKNGSDGWTESKVRLQSFQGMYNIAQCHCAEAEDRKAKK